MNKQFLPVLASVAMAASSAIAAEAVTAAPASAAVNVCNYAVAVNFPLAPGQYGTGSVFLPNQSFINGSYVADAGRGGYSAGSSLIESNGTAIIRFSNTSAESQTFVGWANFQAVC